ncbi:hypothetical protein BV898_15422 [Hypsibius exemplaris]|uniref:Uncharacterized protein n=1 Tax=Hypsibius exemplaris TaxID=2072580 RepID=A0A9X6NHT6_HYPEX|nr:hypothetical protein BV898_15422 [Hypsibius exemplaris]
MGLFGSKQQDHGVDLEALDRRHAQAMAERDQRLLDQQAQLHAQHQAALDGIQTASKKDRARMEATFLDQQADLAKNHSQHLDMIADIQQGNTAERERMEETYRSAQAQLIQDHQVEQERYENRLAAMMQTVADAEENTEALRLELQQPIRDREAKVGFVNGLNLVVRQTNKLLLVGPKGMGKSTFMWLLGQGEKPKQSYGDGTVEILQLDKFVDSIGLTGWNTEELVKLLVLMIYDGIPGDIILFTNDRIDVPLTNLGLLGINTPMIVIMNNTFWQKYEPKEEGRAKKIHLEEDASGVKRVTPEGDLRKVYNLEAYKDIKTFGRGFPITHHDDIQSMVKDRRDKANIRPFGHLLDLLGTTFTVKATENANEHGVEMLFRFIYIYEKKFKGDRLGFMNKATMQDFNGLA